MADQISRRQALCRAALAPALLCRTASAAEPELDSRRYPYHCPELVEITAPGPLVRPDGTALCSWSRRPYLELNFEDARFLPVPALQRFRMKKWDMYHFITPEHYLTVLVSWIGYGAFASAYVYDRSGGAGGEDLRLRPARPEIPLMRDSTAGVTEFRDRKALVRFEVDAEWRRVRVDWPGFARKGLSARIDLHHPAGLESVCATHLTNPRRMHYDHKVNCMEARGELTVAGQTFRLEPRNSFGMLDFGRGFFPRRQFWYWAVTSGRLPDGRPIGFNLGHGNSPDQTNENAIFCDLRLTKVGAVRCEVPFNNINSTWRLYTPDRSVDLEFTPERVRDANLDLGALYSIGQPALGHYSGRLTLADGETITLDRLFGLYEWFDQSW